jgi:hypothetical protein
VPLEQSLTCLCCLMTDKVEDVFQTISESGLEPLPQTLR